MNIQIKEVPTEKLDRTVKREHQGVIAFLNQVPKEDLNEVIIRTYEKGKTPLIVIADGITDVRNIGAIARSAECMGAQAVAVPESGSARLGADAIKSSAGALLRIPVCRERRITDAIKTCQSHGLQVLALTEKGTSPIFDCDLTAPTAIVLGDEHDGVSDNTIRLVDQLVLIPMSGTIGSMNVSVAGGIALYEISRQRGQ
jgi:23S rRNA (guanosine2251-2'-O)-methyltransferase